MSAPPLCWRRRAAKPPARLKFEEGAGLVPVEILREAGSVVGAELTAPQPLSKLSQFSAEQAAGCVSLSAADIRTDRHPPQIVSVGLPFLVAELRLARGAAAREARRGGVCAALCRATAPMRSISIRATCRRPSSRCDLQARMFHPGIERPYRGSRHRQRHGGRGRDARRPRRRTRRRIETADRAGRRHGPAEPASDPRASRRTARSCPRMSAAAAWR